MSLEKFVSIMTALVILACLPLVGCGNGGSDSVDYAKASKDKASSALAYAGSDVCRTCHQAIYESWEKTRHTKKVRRATLATVVNDADDDGINDFVEGGAGVTFDVATSVPAGQTAFDSFTLGAGVEYPKLGWDGENLRLRIGPNTYDVTFLLGGTGKWKQRYMVTIGNGEYISPVQYNDITREYVSYHPDNWYTISGTTLTGYRYAAGETPVSEGRTRDSWQRRCVACHTTGLRDIRVNSKGEYGDDIEDMLADGGLSELPVACEACHGPAARHVELGGGVGTALNPMDLASDRGDEVCGYCHGRGGSTNAEDFGYPWASGALVDNGFLPGDVLADFYVNTTSAFWGDGATHSSSHHQQWLDHRNTPHAKAGVTCFKCHDPHGSGIEGDLRMEPKQLCLSCHDGQGNIDSDDLTLHTRHDAIEAQDCSNCHFNLVAKSGIKYDVNSHTYRIIYPTETETSGIPNSCAACHREETVDKLNGYLAARFPDVKPVAYGTSEADAGGVGFELSASASFDPLGGLLTYEWTFKSGPPSFSTDQILARNSEHAHFVPSQPGEHCFLLVVTNEDGVRSHATEVVVNVSEGIDQGVPDLSQASYVGAETCGGCHSGIHETFMITRHTQKVRRPNEGYGVVFVDTNENGVSDWFEGGFNVETDAFGANTSWDSLALDPGISAPIIDYDADTDTYMVTIGDITYDVKWLLGGTGKWKQRFMATIGEGEYILPIQYNELTNEWVTYHPENWYVLDDGAYTDYLYGEDDDDENETPVSLGRTRDSWQRRCTTCHATGARDMTRDPVTLEYAKSIETMLAAVSGPRLSDTGATCEACHGPGSVHIGGPTIRGSIINPTKLSTLRSNEVCGSCHNRGASVHEEGFGFPWSEDAVNGNFVPGQDLGGFYVPVDEAGSKFWADPFGHAKSHHQQWLDMRWTDHNKEGGMTCASCHVTHNDRISGQLPMASDALCMSCHRDHPADRGMDLNHSRHGNGVTKCVDCHMPLTAKSAINYDISSHSWEVIWPRATADFGIPNSCGSRGCHADWDPTDEDDLADMEAAVDELWGDLRPYAEPRVQDPDDGDKAKRVVAFESGDTLTLDGTKSYDPNGKAIIAWQWSILSAPGGSTATLSSRLLAKPTITVLVPGTYVFSLVVQDARQSSEPETVTVVVE